MSSNISYYLYEVKKMKKFIYTYLKYYFFTKSDIHEEIAKHYMRMFKFIYEVLEDEMQK